MYEYSILNIKCVLQFQKRDGNTLITDFIIWCASDWKYCGQVFPDNFYRCVCVCMCFKYVFATRYKKKVSSFSLLIDLFLKRIDRIHCTLQCTLNRRKGPLKRKIKHGSMHMCDESVNFVLILKRVKFSLFSVDSRTKTYHCIFLCMPFIIWKTSG